MIEYPFPENCVQLGSWPIVLHVVLLAMAIASVIVAFWRRRKPASLWDLPAWIAAVVIAGELVKFGQSDKFERPGLRVSLLIILLVAIGGILELLKRKFGVRAAIGVGLVALCGGVIQMMPQLDGGGREASRVSQCRNRLINIGFALHNYHDDYHTFPATAGDLAQRCRIRLRCGFSFCCMATLPQGAQAGMPVGHD